MVPKEMPKSLVVMGSGAIGIEFASFYRTMGAEVTVVELMPAVMPVEDHEVSAFAKRQFEKQGMKILLEAKVAKVEKAANSVTAHVETKDGKIEKITAERMISAVGVVGNVENLGLEAAGVKVERGVVSVDGYGRTNVPGIHAIGDVAGAPMLAHKAEHERVICVRQKIGGRSRSGLTSRTSRAGIHPQVLGDLASRRRSGSTGSAPSARQVPVLPNGKTMTPGEARGFVKTIFDRKTGQLLGAHLAANELVDRADPGLRRADVHLETTLGIVWSASVRSCSLPCSMNR